MADKKTARKRKRKSAPPKKMGRPTVFDTPKKLLKLKHLMRMYPSLKDAACFFECDPSTIELTLKKNYDMQFREFRDLHMGHTRLTLKQTALTRAQKGGSDRMLQFCLTNLCGWKTRIESTHKGAIKTGVSGDTVVDIMKNPKLAAAMLEVAEKTAEEE